jgi:hypothetical protein
MHVTGAGNFDRVDSQMLERNGQWKTYPPTSSFKASDALGYKGEKTFEQPLIAARSGEQTIPSISFSYFDPDTKRYARAQTSPIKVKIETSRAAASLHAPADASKSDARAAKGWDLRPDHSPTPITTTLVPLYLRAGYVAVPATLALLFAGGLIALRRAPLRASSRTVARALARLSELAHAGDAARFYIAAQEILQRHFAARWRVPADDVSAAGLGARLDRDADALARLFSLAEEAKYSGIPASTDDLSAWLQLVRRHVQEAP